MKNNKISIWWYLYWLLEIPVLIFQWVMVFIHAGDLYYLILAATVTIVVTIMLATSISVLSIRLSNELLNRMFAENKRLEEQHQKDIIRILELTVENNTLRSSESNCLTSSDSNCTI